MAKISTLTSTDIVLPSKIYSSEILNYVEPELVSGLMKTAFYTKVNTNFKEGDRVFIINGNYGSANLIEKDKYKRGRDGYKVISVDRCRIVLDVDYTNVSPYNNFDIDQLIKVYYVENQREFEYINRVLIEPSYLSWATYKFESGNTNMIYAATAFTGGGTDGNVVWSGITNPGFWIRVNGTWVDITTDVLSNNLSTYFYSGVENKLIILCDSFTHIDKLYQEKVVYEYVDGQWMVDESYQIPIISKLNFRDGNFRGTWNDGIYGTYHKKINWDGSQSSWNSGVLLYSYWNNGTMNSKSLSTEQSYYSNLDQNGFPVQTTDFSNNKGFGYNFGIDSSIITGSISTGNFYNMNIGSFSATYSSTEIYYGLSQSMSVALNGGQYKFCDMYFTDINSSSIINSRVDNSKIDNSKITNSQMFDDVLSKSSFKSDSSIKILAYNKEYYKNPGLSSSTLIVSDTKTVHKFYISESDYFKLKKMDSFYLKGINVLNMGVLVDTVMNYFDRRFIMDHVVDYGDPSIDPYSSDVSIMCQVRSKDENYQISYIQQLSFTTCITTYNVNDINLPSIDIIFDRPGSNQMDQLDVDITNGYIIDSDFYSGVIDQSIWESGNHINIKDHVIQRIVNNYLDMSLIGLYPNFQLEVQLSATASVASDVIKVNDIIYLDSIYYDLGYQSFSVSGRYKVASITPLRRLTISEYIVGSESSKINAIGITAGGTFSTLGSTPNYNSITKLDINNSLIKSGVFVKNYFRNSIIYNEFFNNNDTDLVKSNIDQLKLVNFIFNDNKNSIKSGFIYNSFWCGGTWSSGIFNESVWCGGTWSSGTFISSQWRNGVFQNGLFTNNNSDLYSIGLSASYSYNNIYYLWENGTFNNGQVYNSNWYNGTFNNGKFFKSFWYNGQWNNGILGDKNISNTSTQFIGGSWSNGVVENATVGSITSDVDWYYGTFDGGIYTSGPTVSNTWYNGAFNGGEFGGYARWKNGDFNGGKFYSAYGYTQSLSTQSSSYSWENGKFNNGIFGNATLTTNSTWYYGEFNGGIFQGKTWNNGVFYSGIFYGSGTHSVRNEAQQYYNTFSASTHYGLWRDGYVIDNKDLIIKDKKIFSKLERRVDERRKQPTVEMNNILWASGTFSHKGGKIKTSIWTDGSFMDGVFEKSTFNPWIVATASLSKAPIQTMLYTYIPIVFFGPTYSATYSTTQYVAGFNYNTQSCVWYNGIFDAGDFNYSDWYNGTFKNGIMTGAIWSNGTWQYGDAVNVHWKDGIWKNGNWYGSNYNIKDVVYQNYTIIPGVPNGVYGFMGQLISIPNQPTIVGYTPGYDLKASNIIWRTMNSSGTSSVHTWNTFNYTGTPEYHPATNNKLTTSHQWVNVWLSGDYDALYVQDINNSMTASNTISSQIVYSKMGTGMFEKGIWENGAWNNGARLDNKVSIFDSIYQYLRIDEKNWRVLLTGLTGSTNNINIGDKVTIGNLIAIDVNENRRLIKEVFTVIDKGSKDIVFQFKTNFPIRRVERDSDRHKIYVTKNIWKSGAFMNGLFQNGVWGNGIFKGFPYITEMKDAHWIDGDFYGGHYYGTYSTTVGSYSVSTYSTAVVQNFKNFSDENVWTGPIISSTSSLYNSWIDVNYEYNYSATKLYYDSYQLGVDQNLNTTYTNKLNLSGYITFDILSSNNSKFRDSGTTINKYYSLGIKYKKYIDFMGEHSEFNDVDIFSYGWTYSISGSMLNMQASQFVDSNSVDGNGVLSIYNTSGFDTPSFNFSFFEIDSTDFLLEKKRYVLCEFDSLSQNLGTGSFGTSSKILIYPRVTFLDDAFNDGTYALSTNSSAESLNHYTTNTGSTKKFEYFYNKKSLDLLIAGSMSGAASDGYKLDNIKSYEVDMIPFFNYNTRYLNSVGATWSLVNANIVIPYSATANYLDFSFIETTDSFDNPSLSPDQITNIVPISAIQSVIFIESTE